MTGQLGSLAIGAGKLFAGMIRPGILGAALLGAAALPAYALSDMTLSGNAVLTTDYIYYGITYSAENPGVQSEFDLTYKIFYAGIWGSSVDFGVGPNGQELASIEIGYWVGLTPTVGKWNFDIAANYYTYPGAFDPGGEFDYFYIVTSVSRDLFNDRLGLKLENNWSPDYSSTGNNNILEFSYEWTFDKVFYFTPTLGGNVGHQWGDLSQGGFDYTFWSVALTIDFNEKPPFSLEIRYWDTADFEGFTCPPSGTFACDERVVGSLKATF